MFDQMPGGFRKAFFLHDSENYTHLEIAQLTGWSIGTSKSQLHKARQRLRKLFGCGPAKAPGISTVRGGRRGRRTEQNVQPNPVKRSNELGRESTRFRVAIDHQVSA